jgi:hypothetical protein
MEQKACPFKKSGGTMQRFARISIRFMFIVVWMLLCLPIAPVHGSPTDDFPQVNFWWRFSPGAVFCGDPTSTTRLEVHIEGRTDVAQVRVSNYPAPIILYDDGTHGDTTAGDYVFTADQILLSCSIPLNSLTSEWYGQLTVTLTDLTEHSSGYYLTAGVVSPAYEHYFIVQTFPSDARVSATGLAYFIEDWTYSLFGGYPIGDPGDIHLATTVIYNAASLDYFDAMLVMPANRLFQPGTYAERIPYMRRTSNSVKNIGISLYDNSAYWGSTGTLKGAIYHSFGQPSIFAHEFGHIFSTNFGHGSADLEIDDGSHWLGTTDVAGAMSAYYFYDGGTHAGHFTPNGDGTWRLIPNTTAEQFSMLDLYLIGLADPWEVSEVNILKNPDVSNPDKVIPESVTTYTIDQLASNQGGYRSPDRANSPSMFSVAMVVVNDRPFTDAEYAYFSLVSMGLMSYAPPSGGNNYCRTFYWSTQGRGSVYSYLPYEYTRIQRLYLPVVKR